MSSSQPPESGPESGESPSGQSLLDWVAQRFPESPRKRIKEWFRDGRVQLEGRPVFEFHLFCSDPGAHLQVVGMRNAGGEAQTMQRLHHGLKLVYMDNSLAIINKSPGILSVPSKDRSSLSVMEHLRAYLHKSLRRSVEPLPVHRLDEYTSGLICYALNEHARTELIAQVKGHQLERTYLAYVEGCPRQRKGTWRHKLELDAVAYRQLLAAPTSKSATEAIAHYERVNSYSIPGGNRNPARVITKLRIRLETGLKHQIRIQAAAEGMPLLGDRTYHPAFSKDPQDKRKSQSMGHQPPRQALHAVRLGLTHPATGEYQFWQANLPRDLADFEAGLADSAP